MIVCIDATQGCVSYLLVMANIKNKAAVISTTA
ncbi:Uncharacterised protein [Yersinia frederiksenii]|jgi:hypothetical protein|uniref:Uncharacterized protein n=1 Tax=Yersinia frederiksenii TaxID=29484 RepID=A0AAI8ZTG6_YERFR|nr:Uncharacterised protein [Yersinia frederiksenii]